MNMADQPMRHAPPAPPLQPAQLKAQLWADKARFVYAVVMGCRMPGLAQTLAQADVIDHDCLLPGALPPAQLRTAPWLVQLKRDAAFTDWLLFEASAGLGDWGVLALSPAPRLPLRAHLRELLRARLPDGAEIDLAWMDPDILLALLPPFDAAALARFMGPVQTFVITGAQQWTMAEHALGRLQWRHAPVAKAGGA